MSGRPTSSTIKESWLALSIRTATPFSPPGLNTTYQITAVASFTEVVTSLSSNGTVATFALAPTQNPNSFFELYYNPAVVANNLAGTGFNVGTLILSGNPDPSLTNSGNFALAVDGTGQPIILPFDLFNPVNYPGVLSVTGAGSAVVNADVTSFDPAFFVTPVIQLSFNTSHDNAFPPDGSLGALRRQSRWSSPERHPQYRRDQRGESDRISSSRPTPTLRSPPRRRRLQSSSRPMARTPSPHPARIVPVGSTVTWTYDVTNAGNEPLKNVAVTDDNGTPGNTADDFNPTPDAGRRLQRRRHQPERIARPRRGLAVHLPAGPPRPASTRTRW